MLENNTANSILLTKNSFWSYEQEYSSFYQKNLILSMYHLNISQEAMSAKMLLKL